MIINRKRIVRAFNSSTKTFDTGIIKMYNKKDESYIVDFITNEESIPTADVTFIQNNITFDLETLGKTSNAPIIQIGAVKFDDTGKVLSKFMRKIDFNSLSKYGFDIDMSTLKWWFQQDNAAIKSLVPNPNPKTKEEDDSADFFDIKQALTDFGTWIGNSSDYAFWSHATFDPPIILNAISKCKVNLFIQFTAHKDIRTLTHLVGYLDVPRVGIHHNALDDCLYQAAYIGKGLTVSNSKVVPNVTYNLVGSENYYSVNVTSTIYVKDEEDFKTKLKETYDVWATAYQKLVERSEDDLVGIDTDSVVSKIDSYPNFDQYFNNQFEGTYKIKQIFTEFI